MLWDITGVVTSLIVSDVELKAMAERVCVSCFYMFTLLIFQLSDRLSFLYVR